MSLSEAERRETRSPSRREAENKEVGVLSELTLECLRLAQNSMMC